MQDDLIPGYSIQSELGHGAFAEVYLANQQSLDREIALKVMNPRMAEDKDLCERFITEARLVAKLRHRSIVAIHDVGKHHDKYYISMDYVPGPTLAHCISEGSLPAPPLTIVRQIAQALRCAHDHGIVHRDVKPGNILFDLDNTAILTDFGIAKNLATENPLTQVGSIIGTAAYMSPEQVQGTGEVDARSDLYSLGIVLYEMLTGNKPFQGNDYFTTALMHLNKEVPQLPAEFRSYQPLLDRLLAKKPENRFASANELITGLDSQVLSSDDREKPRRKVKPLTWAGVILSSILLATLATWMLLPARNTPLIIPDVEVNVSSTTDNDKDAETRERVDKLIEIAALHEMVGKIASPPGANAIEAYEDALLLDPGNSKAKEGLRRLQSQ